MKKIRELWQNEYFKTAISILVLIALFFIFWYGSILYFNNKSPYLVVSSDSMRPTLEIGDLIIVKRIDPSQLYAAPMEGDIIVYRNKAGELVVHRLISKNLTDDGKYILTTQGDANSRADNSFSDKQYVGKVIARIPFIGHISLFTHTAEGFYFFVFIIICLIIIFMLLPSGEETNKEEETHKKQEERRNLHKILNPNFLIFLMLNILIVGFTIFSLWGTFSFWQPGAESINKWVTIRGMYPDLEYHRNFTKTYLPKVEEVFLYQGLFTYKIDCRMDNGRIRVGVLTFSWAQFAILILVLVNVWMLTKFLLSKGASASERNSET